VWEARAGREGGCAEGRREKGRRESRPPLAPASLLAAEVAETLRDLLVKVVMPRKSVLKVR